MPNDGGVNQFQGFQPDQPFGQIKRLQELVKQAPLPPNSAISSPDRAKRRAVHQQGQAVPPASQPAPNPSPPAQPLPYPVMLAQLTAGLPGADGSLPNVTWLAQQAAKEAGG